MDTLTQTERERSLLPMAQQVYCCDYKTNQWIKLKNSLKMMLIKITKKQFSFFSQENPAQIRESI